MGVCGAAALVLAGVLAPVAIPHKQRVADPPIPDLSRLQSPEQVWPQAVVRLPQRLPNGQRLRAAIEQVDAETDSSAAYFMINCAHPTHFAGVLEDDGPWRERIGGIRANASRMSHAELDEAEELDDGDPEELGGEYRELAERLADLNVLGGCCGTDQRHIAAVADACLR